MVYLLYSVNIIAYYCYMMTWNVNIITWINIHGIHWVFTHSNSVCIPELNDTWSLSCIQIAGFNLLLFLEVLYLWSWGLLTYDVKSLCYGCQCLLAEVCSAVRTPRAPEENVTVGLPALLSAFGTFSGTLGDSAGKSRQVGGTFLCDWGSF